MNRNILANIAGRFWMMLSNIIFLPLYIDLLGIDNYAVISFALILSSVLMILDVGLSASIMREVARRDIGEDEKYRTFRTLEKIYFLLLLICILAGLLFAHPVAVGFINDTPVDRELIALCLKIIAVEAGLQLVFRFYIGTLMGLERQVQANVFNVGWGLARNGLVLLPLLVSPTLPVFFGWQLGATLLLMLLAKWRLGPIMSPWRPAYVPWIDWEALARIRKFAIGIFLIAVVALVNTQLDRIVLSRLLKLEYLGYYNIALAIGTGMLAVASPFQSAIQPRLTAFFSAARSREAGDLYLQVATLVTVLAFSLAATIGVNAEAVVWVWTGRPGVAVNVAPLVPWVVTSYTLLAISSLTYSVALANGYTLYNNILGIASLCVSIPGYWLMIGRYGAVGAAGLFLAIQFLAASVFHMLVNRRFLGFSMVGTYLQLFVVPAAVSLSLALAFTLLVPHPDASRIWTLLFLTASYGLVLVGTGLVMWSVYRPGWRLSDIGLHP